MADIPDVSPTKPIWPTRPDERPPGRRNRQSEAEDRPADKDESEGKDRKDKDDGHLIDEYV